MDMMITEDMSSTMTVICPAGREGEVEKQHNIEVYGKTAESRGMTQGGYVLPEIHWRAADVYYCRACGQYYEIDQDGDKLALGDIVEAEMGRSNVKDGLCGCND